MSQRSATGRLISRLTGRAWMIRFSLAVSFFAIGAWARLLLPASRAGAAAQPVAAAGAAERVAGVDAREGGAALTERPAIWSAIQV